MLSVSLNKTFLSLFITLRQYEKRGLVDTFLFCFVSLLWVFFCWVFCVVVVVVVVVVFVFNLLNSTLRARYHESRDRSCSKSQCCLLGTFLSHSTSSW